MQIFSLSKLFQILDQIRTLDQPELLKCWEKFSQNLNKVSCAAQEFDDGPSIIGH